MKKLQPLSLPRRRRWFATALSSLALHACVGDPEEAEPSSSITLDEVETASATRPRRAALVAVGGTHDYRDLLAPDASDEFRAAGGLLFVHNSGWGALSRAQRTAVASLFPAPHLIEISANGDNADAWVDVVRGRFKASGVRPSLAAVNFLGTRTTEDQTLTYIAKMKAEGIDTVAPVFGPNSGQWRQGSFVTAPAFAGLRHAIIHGGGVVTDAPPAFFFAQDAGYRNFIIDMIKWTNGINRTSVVIVSPNKSGASFAEDSERFVRELERVRAIPTYWVVENYLPTSAPPPEGYPNRIGSEDEADNVLGVARWLTEHIAAQRI